MLVISWMTIVRMACLYISEVKQRLLKSHYSFQTYAHFHVIPFVHKFALIVLVIMCSWFWLTRVPLLVDASDTILQRLLPAMRRENFSFKSCRLFELLCLQRDVSGHTEHSDAGNFVFDNLYTLFHANRQSYDRSMNWTHFTDYYFLLFYFSLESEVEMNLPTVWITILVMNYNLCRCTVDIVPIGIFQRFF